MEPLIFMFCLTLHNIEEALWLSEWNMKNMPNIRIKPQKQHFIFAALGITILGYLAAGLHIIYPNNTVIEFCYIGFVGAMLANVVIPHLLLTLLYKKYCPGLFTGFFLLIPFNSIILYNAVKAHWQISEVLISTVIVGAILLAAIPFFEITAKKLLKDLS